MKPETSSRLTLSCILITVLLDMVGLGIIVPVLPELIEELNGGSVANAAEIGGYLVFVYALMQFICSPILGGLSDRFGRRPVLLLSLIGLTIDYLMMGFAPVIAFLYVGRVLAGISGAAVATATAYIADITPPEKRAQRFGLIGGAFGLGFIIGPVIGGELGEFGPRVPFFVAAGLAFANFLFGLLVLPESLPKDRRRPFNIKRANPFGALYALREYPVVLWLLGSLFLLSFASQAFPSVWSFFTIEVVNFSSSQIGRALGAFGIAFAICQALLVGPLVKAVGEWTAIILGLAAAVVAFTGTAFIHTEFGLYGFLLVGAFCGLAIPALNGMISRNVPDNGQGELQGAVNAVNSLASILGPLAATQLFAFFTRAPEGDPAYFPGAPFIGAAVAIVLSLMVFIYTALRFDLMHRRPVARHPKHLEYGPPGAPPPPHDEEEQFELELRRATEADWPKIWQIIGPVFAMGETYAVGRDITEPGAKAYWLGPNHETWVVTEGEKILGTYYLKANHAGGGSHIANCGYMVGAEAQGRGIARMMCTHSLERARQRGFKAMQFNFVISTNERAVKLWEAFGFEVLARLPKAFQHPRLGYVDALVMWKSLDGEAPKLLGK